VDRGDPPDLADVQRREEIRSELTQEFNARAESLNPRDRRLFALLFSLFVLLCFVVPVGGAVIGLAVRAFRLAAGN